MLCRLLAYLSVGGSTDFWPVVEECGDDELLLVDGAVSCSSILLFGLLFWSIILSLISEFVPDAVFEIEDLLDCKRQLLLSVLRFSF